MSTTVTRTHVGTAAEFAEGDRKIVEVNGDRVGVFRVDGGFVAYLNICAHQGGPVCEGQYFPRVRARVGTGGELLSELSDHDTPHLVCAWHGWEYDLRTGVMVADERIKLRRYEVTVEEGEVYVHG